MNVLHLFNEIKFSGAEIMYANAAPIFQKEGINFIAFSTGVSVGGFAPQFQEANIKVYHKPINFKAISFKGFKYHKELYSFLKKERIDVLHIHRSNIYFAAIIAWLAGVRCIKTQHSTFLNPWYTRPYQIYLRFLLRKFLKVKFQSIGESVYNNELVHYKNPTVQVNNWFDEKKFFPAQSENERLNFRNELSISPDAFVIISTGNCNENKNHFDIIKALAVVRSKINCVYLHLGHGVTEKEEEQLARELGVIDSIIFLGNQVNVRDYLIAADLFIMTSKFEGLGNAALEAMACKIPCVLYDVPGLRDLIKNDNTGVLIYSDYNHLADKIFFFQQTPCIAKQKAVNAYYLVNKDFSIIDNVYKMILLYK